METKRTMKTTKRQIANYWKNNNLVKGLGILNEENPHKHCFNCGWSKRIERCHIIPLMLGGKDEPSNYVLLCNQCHNEAPDVKNPYYMWFWIVRNSDVSKVNYNMSKAIKMFEDDTDLSFDDLVNKFDSAEDFQNTLLSIVGYQNGRIKVNTYFYAFMELAKRKFLLDIVDTPLTETLPDLNSPQAKAFAELLKETGKDNEQIAEELKDVGYGDYNSDLVVRLLD